MSNYKRIHAEPKYQSDKGQYVPIEDVLKMEQHIKELEAGREIICKWAIEQGFSTGHADTVLDLWNEIGPQIIERIKKLETLTDALQKAAAAGNKRYATHIEAVNAEINKRITGKATDLIERHLLIKVLAMLKGEKDDCI